MQLASVHQLGLSPEFTVLPAALKACGYRTAAIGKWHLGYEKQFRPLQHGFDYAIGPLGGLLDYFHHVEDVDTLWVDDLLGGHNLAMNDREVFRDGYYMTHLITDEAKSWINRQSEEHPFFLYIPYTTPHYPYQGPDDFHESPLPSEEWNTGDPSTYWKMIEEMDRGIGEILEMLERKDLAENTLVIFFSDNGPASIGSAGSLRGNKGQVYEGGIRVPCIIRWPGHIEPGLVSHQVSIGFDISASLLSLSGTDISGYQLDGMDIIDHISTGKVDLPRTLYWRKLRGTTVLKAIRDQDHKYLITIREGKVIEEKLYDLNSDPSEENDLSPTKTSILNTMKKKLSDWEQEMRPEWSHRYLTF
jgi:N-acetylgalactosamine-6-sulfatase